MSASPASAADVIASPLEANIYESPKLVAEYLLLHYGDADETLGGLPGPRDAVGFPTRLVQELLAPPAGESRALDLGCAVGGSSFALARHCRHVHALDTSGAFIAAARRLREKGTLAYEKALEGTRIEPSHATVPVGIDRSRVHFEQGDATVFPGPHPTAPWPVVLAANLLCRVPEPAQLIRRFSLLVEPGGQLLLTTPFTWLDGFTPREHWIGGTPATGRSLDALQALLSQDFALEHTIDLPFLIREHARKFQYGVAFGTRWRRR